MPAKIRLSRHGKKGQPFYHIVIADGRAPRDGKFIEKIGTYNPLTKPAEIVLNFDKTLEWLTKGAQPTDTVRAILSYKGVLYKNHLLKGIKKGALTEEQAEVKFQAWLKEKEAKIAGKISDTENKIRTEKKKRLEAETKFKEAKAEELAQKRAKEAEKIEEKVEPQPIENETSETKTEIQTTVEEKQITVEQETTISETESKEIPEEKAVDINPIEKETVEEKQTTVEQETTISETESKEIPEEKAVDINPIEKETEEKNSEEEKKEE